MQNFKLEPAACPSDKEFSQSISVELWQSIKNKHFNESSGICCGCGYQPDNKYKLQLHLEEKNEKKPEKSIFFLVCEACHAIRHFDKFIENSWGVLCNSVFSQEELIIRCRTKNKIFDDIQRKDIILLKKTPLQYFNDIKESELNKNSKIKIIFGKNFQWK